MPRRGGGRAASRAGLRRARPRRHGHLHERRDGRDATHADGDAARRAPEREPRRPAERAHRPRAGARRDGAVRPSRRRAQAVLGSQPVHGLRPGRLHPLQPLRSVHAGGDDVLGADVRGAWRRGADRPHARRLVARHRVRALRGLPLRLPDRRHLREVHDGRAARARAGAREDEDDVHVLRRRLPDRPQRRPADEAHREGDLGTGVPAQRGQPLREGPLRLQLRPSPRPADRAARARRGRRAAPDRLGHGARGCGRRAAQA